MNILDVDENGILLKVKSAYNPPVKKIDKIVDKLKKKLDIDVEDWFGNNDENTIYLSFKEILVEEKVPSLYALMTKYDKS